MQHSDTAVYHSTTVPSLKSAGPRRNYLDNISYASLNPKRCVNVIIVVSGVLLLIAGLSLILYGALFYASLSMDTGREYRLPPSSAADASSHQTGGGGGGGQQQQQLRTYLVLVWVGVPVSGAGALLWLLYLYRTGRCRHCPLCPGARRRHHQRHTFQQQCLEAGNISNSYARHPTTTLPLDEQQRLVQHSATEQTMDETASMIDSNRQPVIRSIQTTI